MPRMLRRLPTQPIRLDLFPGVETMLPTVRHPEITATAKLYPSASCSSAGTVTTTPTAPTAAVRARRERTVPVPVVRAAMARATTALAVTARASLASLARVTRMGVKATIKTLVAVTVKVALRPPLVAAPRALRHHQVEAAPTAHPLVGAAPAAMAKMYLPTPTARSTPILGSKTLTMVTAPRNTRNSNHLALTPTTKPPANKELRSSSRFAKPFAPPTILPSNSAPRTARRFSCR